MSPNFNIAQKNINSSTIRDVLLKNNTVTLSNASVSDIIKCREYLSQRITNSSDPIYGVNTGFGSLCNTKIDVDKIEKLQTNLILSHACGTGDLVPSEIVKIMLFLKIRSLSFGYSGVRLDLINMLMNYYNNNILPIIYTQGSLGASGDLAPLAHLSLPLIGKGEVLFQNKITPSLEAMSQLQLNPINLSFKEGLALLNGTQFMSAYGVWCVLEAKKIFYLSNIIACISLESFSCKADPFNELISNIRPHAGQGYTSKLILKILKGSESFYSNKKYIQDPYSFRCIPQVHGATFDVINHVDAIFNIEINSVTDNPSIFFDQDKIISGGNFHGQPLAMAMDYLAISLSELGNISERRTYQLISGDRALPPYLIDNPGLNSGMMISQYTAASIVSQNKQLATPSSVDSIVSSNGQEDHVSMGANAATKLIQVVNNVKTILAIELLNATQAIDIIKPNTSPFIKSFVAKYRKSVPFLNEDNQLNIYIKSSQEFISNFDVLKSLDIND